ncbi:MAG: hypothetical protein H0V86_07620 [Chloroflexia bacterium]|nr:hypothetical protein [Chloroflexia bacterium]
MKQCVVRDHRRPGWLGGADGTTFDIPDFVLIHEVRQPVTKGQTPLTFHTAFGVATAEPYGATRWRFNR